MNDVLQRPPATTESHDRNYIPDAAPEGMESMGRTSPGPGQTDLASSLRDEGMARAALAVSGEWRDRAWQAIVDLADSGEEFTAQDVRDTAGEAPGHANAMGFLFTRARKLGLIRCIGRRTVDRPSLHGHELRVWVGTRPKNLAPSPGTVAGQPVGLGSVLDGITSGLGPLAGGGGG